LPLPPPAQPSAPRPARLFIVSLAGSTYDSGVHDATEPTSSHYAADSTRPTDRTGPRSFRTPIASVEICITRYSMSRRPAGARHVVQRPPAHGRAAASAVNVLSNVYTLQLVVQLVIRPASIRRSKGLHFHYRASVPPRFVSVNAANNIRTKSAVR